MRRIPSGLKAALVALSAVLLLSSVSLSAAGVLSVPFGALPQLQPSKPQGAVENLTPQASITALEAGSAVMEPRSMHLLLVTATAAEPSYEAARFFLDRLGVPYTTMIATQQTLTNDFLITSGSTKGNFQGVILATGNLGYESEPGHWQSAFSDDEWALLWDYEAQYGVRQVTLYTYPGSLPDNYGLNLVTERDTETISLDATLTDAGRSFFPYLQPNAVIPIKHAWTYLTTPEPGVVPLVQTTEGHTLMAIKTYPDGRENLALTMDHNPYLLHSLVLQYGITNWLTKGIFIGERHAYLNVQVDDLLIADNLWDIDALSDETGLEYRMTAADMYATTAWRRTISSTPNFGGWTFEWAFNGSGAQKGEWLTNAVISLAKDYRWINHTWDHENLDLSTYEDTAMQLKLNNDIVGDLKIPDYSKKVLVTPDVSGLDNYDAMWAAYKKEVRYVVCDTSRPSCSNYMPNTGIPNPHVPQILMIPRRPTNIFYNTSTPAELVSEYNHMYRWYWGRDLTYAEILDLESDVYLSYMLRFDINPLMFHQSNTRTYDGSHTLLGDVIDRTAAKYNALMNLPVVSLPMQKTGERMLRKAQVNAANVSGVLYPGSKIVLTSSATVLAPVTGIVYSPWESYGGQPISQVKVEAGKLKTISLD